MGLDERLRLLQRAVDEGEPWAEEELRRLEREIVALDPPGAGLLKALSPVIDHAAKGRMPRKAAFLTRLRHEARQAIRESRYVLTNFPDRLLVRAWIRHGRRNTTSGTSQDSMARWSWFPYDPTTAASGMFHVAFAFVGDLVTVGITRNPREWRASLVSMGAADYHDGRLEVWAAASEPDRVRTDQRTLAAWSGLVD